MTAKPLKFGEVEWGPWDMLCDDPASVRIARELWRQIDGPRLRLNEYEVGVRRGTGELVALRAPRIPERSETDEVPCVDCDGLGVVECIECRGDGVVECDKGREHDCEGCNGYGNSDCRSCDGTGGVIDNKGGRK